MPSPWRPEGSRFPSTGMLKQCSTFVFFKAFSHCFPRPRRTFLLDFFRYRYLKRHRCVFIQHDPPSPLADLAMDTHSDWNILLHPTGISTMSGSESKAVLLSEMSSDWQLYTCPPAGNWPTFIQHDPPSPLADLAVDTHVYQIGTFYCTQRGSQQC